MSKTSLFKINSVFILLVLVPQLRNDEEYFETALFDNEMKLHYNSIKENTAFCTAPCSLAPAAYLCAMKILMVCLGNICRSPLAEGILQQKVSEAGLNWVVESAGTNGYHTGEHPHPLSSKVALQHGIDIRQQVARRFVAEDFERYDKIYAMAADVIDDMKKIARQKFNAAKVDLLMNALYPAQNRDVPDPWYGPEPGYHEVYEMIDAACEKIINKS